MTAIRKYASPWAYLVYVCLLVGGLYAATLWYRERLRTKNRLQMAVIFTNITHELLTPLTRTVAGHVVAVVALL